MDPPVIRLLDRLDGTLDRPAVLASGGALGIEPSRVERLLDLLAASGVLEDAGAPARPLHGLDADERARLAPDLAALSLLCPEPGGALAVLAARQRAVVEVVGAGRVGAPVAAQLAAAGIETVTVADAAPATMADVAVGGVSRDDAGVARSVAAQRAIRRVTGTPEGARAAVGRFPDLVVVAPVGTGTDADTQRLVEAGIAHLPVRVSGSRAVVGPLVLPGRTSCLSCADHHRADRDPVWPLLVAQLSSPSSRQQEAVDGTLAAAAAAHTALLALDFLDGLLRDRSDAAAPVTVNGTVELSRPGWQWRRRSWLPHPRCPCRCAEWIRPAGGDALPEWVRTLPA